MKTLKKETFVLITSVFIAGVCSLIYELLIGTASSYFLGDSVKQFSITIGIYMAAMGIGSLISRIIHKNILSWFIAVEIVLGFVGGLSIPLLYFSYAYTTSYHLFMIILILFIGILIGLEIPLLTRIMDGYYSLKINISNVLSLDYLGALIATLLFPFLLLPFWGTFKSSLFFGMVNMGIGFLNIWCFRDEFKQNLKKLFTTASIFVLVFLGLMFLFSNVLMKNWSSSLFQDRIIFSKQTRYQKVVLTRNKEDLRLFINGNLQFSSIDEYRYHEPLIHIPMAAAPFKSKVLVLGGGDGLAVREILKHKEVKEIRLVDIDPEITRIATHNYFLVNLNKKSLLNKKVKVIHDDAFKYLEDTGDLFDIIIADLPDPNNVSLARLYSREFYRLVLSRLSRTGVFVTQATSSFFSTDAFWCIAETIQKSGFKIYPYHVYVPSFGDWGFVMASRLKLVPGDIRIQIPTRYLENHQIKNLFSFPLDIKKRNLNVSTMDHPFVLTYYLRGWKYWD